MKICIKRLRSTDLTGSSREQHKDATVKSWPVKAPFLFERNAKFCQMGKMTPGNNYFKKTTLVYLKHNSGIIFTV